MVGDFCGNSLWSGVNGYIAPTCESLLNVCRKFWVHVQYSKVKRIKSDLSKVTKLQSVFSFLKYGQKRELLYRQFMFFLYAPRIRIYTI